MKIPYGVPNFGDIRREGYFYVDKTPFLPMIERIGGRYLIFLRPRRMGKSVFVSLLAHYYDLALADEFDELFSGLWVHANPTPERNRYLVLSLDFSVVAADGGQDTLRQTFFETVKIAVMDLVRRYRARLPALAEIYDDLRSCENAESLITTLGGGVRASGHKLYVLIDEYDNFTNRLLAEGAQDLYETIARRTGFVRSFYSALKAGAGSGAVGRIFITGVAPLLLDDVSSGFNIATHVSQRPDFNTLAGFTRADVEGAVDAFLAARPHLASTPELSDKASLMVILERYYNGYRFSPGTEERVFNSDMVLYFFSEVDSHRGYPGEMLDPNVRTDYGRLQKIGTLAGAPVAERRALLSTILAEGAVESALIRQFGVQGLSTEESFISLLYYMGMLTLAEQPPYKERLRLEIPNRVIRELQWGHLAMMLTEQEHLTLDAAQFRTALETMAIGGEIEPFLALFHDRVLKVVGNRDLRGLDERAIKLMLLAFLSLTRLVYPLSEKEFAQGYCDLFLGVSPLSTAARFAWLLELKYLPATAKPAQIEKAFAEAEEQVARYAGDERLVPLLTRGQTLKAGSLVFTGAKKVIFRPWPAPAETPAKAAKKTPAKAAKKTPAKAARKTPAKAAKKTARR